MLDNQIDSEKYQEYLASLAVSADPVIQAYTDRVQEIVNAVQSRTADDFKQDFIAKWTRNLEKYAASTDAVVSQYATAMLAEFLKLANSEITVAQFKNTIATNPSDENIDLNSTSNIRNCIISLFEE
jgi:hypothetical protein